MCFVCIIYWQSISWKNSLNIVPEIDQNVLFTAEFMPFLARIFYFLWNPPRWYIFDNYYGSILIADISKLGVRCVIFSLPAVACLFMKSREFRELWRADALLWPFLTSLNENVPIVKWGVFAHSYCAMLTFSMFEFASSSGLMRPNTNTACSYQSSTIMFIIRSLSLCKTV